jgi:hypothetical protein
MASPHVADPAKTQLQVIFAELDPIELLRNIRRVVSFRQPCVTRLGKS